MMEFTHRLYSQATATGSIDKKGRKKVLSVAAISEQDAEQELEKLNSEILLHDQRYYEDDAPIITDAAYDKLVRRAESLVGKFLHLGHLVPKLSSLVGLAKSSKLGDFKHTTPMLSLNNCFSKLDLISFFTKSETSIKSAALLSVSPSAADTHIEYAVEPKIDGLSLSLHYDAHSGVLLRAGTRGDGRIGEDVTGTVRRHVLASVLPYLSSQHLQTIIASTHLSEATVTVIEVRGEIYMSKEDLKEMNRRRVGNNEGAFSTARNAAAGSLRRVPSTVAGSLGIQGDDDVLNDDDGRGLSFYAYSLYMVQSDAPPVEVCSTQSDTLSLLETIGFSVARPWTLCGSGEEVHQVLTQWELDRPRWAFDADGAVIKVNRYHYHSILGCSSRAPRWALAFKFAGNSAVTRLRAIEVQVGRTGLLTPVGQRALYLYLITIMIDPDNAC